MQCASLNIDPYRLLPEGAQALDVAPDHELWPEHATAWQVFTRSQTQWRRARHAMSGHVDWLGLDYPGVAVVMQLLGVADAEREPVFAELQVLENEFLLIKAAG